MTDQKKSLRIAVRKFAPFESVVTKLWDVFCSETGCDFTLEAVPMDLLPLHQATIEENGLKNGEWDIAHISSDWITEAYTSGSVENLLPYVRKNKPEQFPEGWPDSLRQMQFINHEIAGLPFHDGPECLIYRKDLFQDPLYQHEYRRQYGQDLMPPQTWEQFLNVAGFFQRPQQPLYGAVFAAYPDGHNAVFDFCLQLWTRGGQLTDGNGFVNINIDAAEEGLKFYRQLLQQSGAVHPYCNEYDSIKAGEAFARGEVAMMINWFGFAAFCEIAESSNVKGCVDIAEIPHGLKGESVSLNSYWIYTIGKGSKHKELSYEFIKFAINKKNDKLLTMEGGIGCRISTWHDEEVNNIVPFYHKLEGLHRHARSLPAIPQWSQIAVIIDGIMLKTIGTDIPIPQLLNEGQDQINKIFDKHGHKV
jgi:multiple sugar transport system substrate-binding protein